MDKEMIYFILVAVVIMTILLVILSYTINMVLTPIVDNISESGIKPIIDSIWCGNNC